MRLRESRRQSPRQGQILIMMALLTTTLIIFFGMVVSVGHLVQARINLQNAVDLAALSGASWQARMMNHLSVINYRLRQNYKWTLFDLYVTQSRFNGGWKREVLNTAGGLRSQIPSPRGTTGLEMIMGICQQVPGWNPMTDEELATGSNRGSQDTDLCQLVGTQRGSAGIPLVQSVPVPSLNPALQAINEAIKQTREEQLKICKESSGHNKAYFEYLTNRLTKQNKAQEEELDFLEDRFRLAFSGEPAPAPVSPAGNQEADQAIWQTFFSNLISANQTGAKIEYLNPPETRAPHGSKEQYFERQNTWIQIPYIDFEKCKIFKRESQPESFFLGFSRARSNQTLSAGGDSVPALKMPFNVILRASVRPDLLFWPRSLTPTLVAVSGAKPFGSRIAPSVKSSNMEVSGNPTLSTESLANMSFYPGDLPGGGNGWYGMGHKTILRELYNNLPLKESGVNHLRPHPGNSSPDCSGSRFLCMALAPTLYEGLLWTVYPFPALLHSRNRADVEAFPSEINLNLNRPAEAPVPGGSIRPSPVAMAAAYLMPDRMERVDRGLASSMLNIWHTTTLIGNRPNFREGSKPLFYADANSAASAFSPDFDFKNPDFTQGVSKGRFGYQIKLASLSMLCDEMRKSEATLSADLKLYCPDGPGGVPY